MSSVKLTTTGGSGGTLELKAPANTTSNAAVQLTLPVDDGAANTWLKSNGSGVLSFAAPTATEIGTTSGTASASTFLCGNNTWATPSGGKVLQIVQTTKEDSSSTTSTSWADIPDMELAITPSASTSKVLVQGVISWTPYGSSHGGLKLLHKVGSGSYSDTWKGDADSNRERATYWTYGNTGENWAAPICFLHSPNTTSAVTYKWQWHASPGGYTIYINRTYNDTAYQGCTVSNIVLSEIGA